MASLPVVALLCGGVSPEHEISIRSARNIFKAIDTTRHQAVVIGVCRQGRWQHLDAEALYLLDSLEGVVGRELIIRPGHSAVFAYADGDAAFPSVDLVFPIIHGPFGEDGTLQGLLSMLGLPFVGPGTLGSAIGMDKDMTKRLLRDAGLDVAPWVTLYAHEEPDSAAIVAKLGLPVFVKPANMGSSVGVSRADTVAELAAAVQLAFRFDRKVLVEQAIPGREIETAVLGNLDAPVVSGVGEIVVEKGFYDYDSKYLSADAAKVVVPAENLSSEDIDKIRSVAVQAFRVLQLEGMARMDVFLCTDGRVSVNEPNTLPGFTNISMYPKLWEQAGLPYPDLVGRLLELALERHRRETSLERTLQRQSSNT
jgi:D-alanine-D-alanine ligase